MQIRLTDKGLKLMGWGSDRRIAAVSDKRAFELMNKGSAVKDKRFMALYASDNPDAVRKHRGRKKATEENKK